MAQDDSEKIECFQITHFSYIPDMHLLFILPFLTFSFLAALVTCGSSQAREWAWTTEATQAAAVTPPDPQSAVPQGTPKTQNSELQI